MRPLRARIEKLVYGGKGLAKVAGRTVFIPYTAVGDLVEFKEVARKNSYSEGKLERILEPSADRQKPRCPYFGKCGGCDWQHIKYERQVQMKRDILEENLQRIGKIKKPNIDEVIASPHPWHYRNRAQFKIKNGKFGFYAKGTHEVVDIDSCLILKEEISRVIPRLKSLAFSLPTTPSELHVYCTDRGEFLLKFVYREKFKKIPFQSPEELRDFLGVNVIGFGIYKFGSSGYPERIKFFGRDFAFEKVDRFKYRVSADSFFQVNRFQVKNLIRAVSKGAMEHSYLLAGDLYCGVGTLTIPISRYVHRAFGVESNFSAICDAIYNRDANGLRNINFYCKEAEDSITLLKDMSPDLLVVDPPRSGLSQKLIREIARLPRIKRLIYVSCNPATLSRDLSLFYQNGMPVEKVKLIDMFPQTYHVESIAYLRKVK